MFLRAKRGVFGVVFLFVKHKLIGFTIVERKMFVYNNWFVRVQKLRVWGEKHDVLAPKLLCFRG